MTKRSALIAVPALLALAACGGSADDTSIDDDGDDVVSIKNTVKAIASYERSLISGDSRYDRYAHGYHDALNDEEIRNSVDRSLSRRTPSNDAQTSGLSSSAIEPQAQPA